MTPAELVADYRRLRRNLRRLGQVEAVAYRRYELHAAQCEYDDPWRCPECMRRLVRAQATAAAHMTITGEMVWR